MKPFWKYAITAVTTAALAVPLAVSLSSEISYRNKLNRVEKALNNAGYNTYGCDVGDPFRKGLCVKKYNPDFDPKNPQSVAYHFFGFLSKDEKSHDAAFFTYCHPEIRDVIGSIVPVVIGSSSPAKDCKISP